MIINNSGHENQIIINPLEQPVVLRRVFKFLDLNAIFASRLTCRAFAAAAPLDDKIITQEIPIIKQILGTLRDGVSLNNHDLTNKIINILAQYDLEFSLIIAEGIRDSSCKAYALATIAYKIAPSDPERALEIAERINKHSYGMRVDRADVLAYIAEVIAFTFSDLDRALKIIEEKVRPLNEMKAADVAEKINGPKEKDKILAKEAETIAITDPERALTMTEEIKDPDVKNEVLATIAEKFASSDIDRALEIAEEIQNYSERERVLANLVRHIASTDPDRALEIVEERIEGSYSQDEAFSSIAELVLAFKGNVALEKVLEIIERIKDLEKKTRTLINIAERIATSDPKRAIDIYNDALKVVEQNSWPSKNSLLIDIAKKIAPINIAKAVDIIERFKNPSRKAQAFAIIAKEIARASSVHEESKARLYEAFYKVLYNKALEIAESIRDSKDKDEILADIAKEIASLDINKALEIVKSIQDPIVKNRTLSNIAEGMVYSDVDRAIEIAKSIQDSKMRAHALADIAKKMIRYRDKRKKARAKNLYYEALGLIKGLKSSKFQITWFLENTPSILLEEPRKIQDVVKDFDPELEIYFLLYALRNCKFESIQTLAKGQFKRISNELRNPSTKRRLIPDPSEDEISKKLRTLATF